MLAWVEINKCIEREVAFLLLYQGTTSVVP